MRSLNEAFLKGSGRFNARIALEDGTEYQGEDIVTLTLNAGAVGAADRLTLGGAPSAELKCVLNGNAKSLQGKQIQLFLGRQGPEGVAEVMLGRFTITKVEQSADRTSVTGYDAMTALLERAYFPSVSGETTAKAVLADIAKTAGIELVLPDDFADVTISEVTTGFTLREMVGYMAALLGANARIDSAGRLEVKWFSETEQALGPEQIYMDGLSLDSEEWTLKKIQCIVATTSTNTSVDADGNSVQTSTERRETLTAGGAGGCIALENRWMTQKTLDALYQMRQNFSYHGGKIKVLGDLAIEPGDIIQVTDQSGNTVRFPVMAQMLEYDGGLKMTLSAYACHEDSTSTTATGPLTRAMERWDAQLAFVRQLEAEHVTATSARIDKLKAENAELAQLTAQKADISDLTAATARIDQLDADKLSVKDAEVKYANIDFSNIDQASIEHLYATSGIIKDLTIDGATITGELVGVTIKGDLIEGGTVVADKLVVQGENGLYYKLNTDGVSITAEQTEYNSLNGSVITAKSVTAEKISVSDLVAFGADIGGFHITTDAIYSGVKESVDNTTRGVYLDSGGQLCVGDGTSFLRYRMEEDGSYKLELVIASNGLTIDSDNFKLTADGTVTAAAGEIGGFQLKTERVNGLNRHYLFGGYEQKGKQYGLRLQPSGGTDEWDSQIRFANGGSGVTLEAERYETGEGIRKLNIYGAPVNAVSGLMIGSESVGDFVAVSGTSGGWEYIKYASGLAMMWRNVTAEYSAASVLEKWVSYPFALQAGVAAFGTLEGVGSNAGAALGWNVKIVPQSDNKNARVFVHNPSGSFGGADALTVAVLVLGRWK